MLLADIEPGLLQLWIIVAYLGALILLGLASSTVFKGTAVDYFVASRGVGPVVLVLSIFGTTMTAFAIQGSSGEAWASGIGVYGKMASWSGIVHAACFFLIGVKLWSFGKRFGYQTQIQFFRERFESSNLGLVLFPSLVLLQMPYIIIGIIGSGNMITTATSHAFPDLFPSTIPRLNGAVPFWLGTFACTAVVWLYVSLGGARATAWANALQTMIFLVVGVVTFYAVADKLGGAAEATRAVQELNPSKLTRGVSQEHEEIYAQRMAEWRASTQPAAVRSDGPADGEARAPAGRPADKPSGAVLRPHKPKEMSELEFLSYGAIPLSVAMFPHLFQLWLTARSAKAFRLTVTLHPILIMLIWAPCIALGIWATSAIVDGRAIIPYIPTDPSPPHGPNLGPNAVIGLMVQILDNPVVSGLLAAGVLAAILGGMDAQFLCLGSMFTHDIVDHYGRQNRMTDKQRLLTGRVFVIMVVLASWLLSLWLRETRPIFGLAVWCFSGFAALFPLVFAALYWKRATKWGAYASVIAGLGLGAYYYWQATRKSPGGGRGEPLVDVNLFGTHVEVVPALPMVLVAAAALVIVSWLTAPPSRSTVEKFFSPAPAEPETAASR